jgi:hypothetical protein
VIRWIDGAVRGRARGNRPPTRKNRSPLTLRPLEDRVTPTLGAPTVTDPAAAVRVDQDAYTIDGHLAAAARAGTEVRVFADTNHNGVFNPGTDAQVASAPVAEGTTDLSVAANLQPDAANRYFVAAADSTGRSPATTVRLITEDSTPPAVSGIAFLGPAGLRADPVKFRVRFTEPVTGVDPTDFRAVTSGSVTAGPIAVTGSGSVYTVTVGGLAGQGKIGLAVADDDSITDVLTNPAQDHPLGGAGTGNGDFTGALAHAVDRLGPTVVSITRVGSVIAGTGAVSFKVTFSEPVRGVDVRDFALAPGAPAGARITRVTGSGSTYTVTVSPGTGAGPIQLTLVDNNSITDLAGNALGGPAVGDGAFNTGDSFMALAADVDSVATVALPAIHLNLLGLHVDTSEVIVSVSAEAADGKLLGNLLTTASHLIDLQQAADALNQVLSTTVGLLNSADLGITLGSGAFDTRTVATTDVLTLHVAPVDLDLLGAVVNTNPIDVRISAESGPGQILGNIVSDLVHLFDDLPGTTLNIDVLNQKLTDLLNLVSGAVGSIPPADVPTVQPSPGMVLSLTVPALNVNLLGLNLQTTPITVNANAQTGDGNLLGNVLTSLLNTLDATPDKIAQLNNTLNGVLARVVGVLNVASLTVAPSLVDSLPPALQTLLNPVLVAPAGSSAPVLDLVIASQDGTSPPVDVNLLGLVVTTSNIDAKLTATTGDGQILGNLVYNLANLANPDGSSGLLALLNALGSGNLDSTAGSDGGGLSGATPAPQQLLQIRLKPIDLNLLGLEVHTDPVVVTLSTQGGDGKLLGNLLGAVSTLVNFPGVGAALNNALGAVVDLVNSVNLALPPGAVGSGPFDTGTDATTPVLDAFIAPVHLDLLGAVITTEPIHATIVAHSGQGLVLGNVVADLAHLFDNPPADLTVDEVNARLAQLLDELNQQIPNIPPAATPPVTLGPDQFLELTVPAIDLNLLGLKLNTTPITVNAFDQTGNGNLLGNFLNSLLNTIDATPGNLTALSQNLNGLLAKVVGVLNASSLTLSQAALDALPPVLQTLLDPLLISALPGQTVPILNLVIDSEDGTSPPVQADLLGLVVTTSDINAQLSAVTGDGLVLGNLLFNVAHLLDAGNTTTLLLLLEELAGL